MKKTLFLSGFILYSLLLAALTLAPAEFLSKSPINVWDKLMHALTFGCWSALFYLNGYFFTTLNKETIFKHAVGWGIFYGVLIEILQLTLPINRSFEWTDMLADAIGSLTFTLLTQYAIRTEKSAFKSN